MAIDFQPIDSAPSKIDFQPADQQPASSPSPLDKASKYLGYAEKAVPYLAAFTTGNPMEGISQYAAPKIADAMTQGANYLGGQVAEKGGQYFPNIPPQIPAAAGLATSFAANPMNYAGIGETGFKPSVGLSPETAAVREARTGVPARDFQRLYKDPGAMFAKGSVQDAGQAIGNAKRDAGIDLGVSSDPASLTPENVDRINPTKSMKMDDINAVLGKVKAGQPSSPQEAQNALDSVNSILAQPSVQNNPDVFRQWVTIKSHLKDALNKVAPDVNAANQDYARLKLRDTFSPMDAVNKNGKPSKLGLMARGTAAAIGGLVGHQFGDGFVGTGAGYEAAKYLNQAYHAPYVAGLQTALQSYLDQKAGPALAGAENAGSVPVASLVQTYLDRNKARQTDQTPSGNGY